MRTSSILRTSVLTSARVSARTTHAAIRSSPARAPATTTQLPPAVIGMPYASLIAAVSARSGSIPTTATSAAPGHAASAAATGAATRSGCSVAGRDVREGKLGSVTRSSCGIHPDVIAAHRPVPVLGQRGASDGDPRGGAQDLVVGPHPCRGCAPRRQRAPSRAHPRRLPDRHPDGRRRHRARPRRHARRGARGAPRPRAQRDDRRRRPSRARPPAPHAASSTGWRSTAGSSRTSRVPELKTLAARERMPGTRPGNAAYDGAEGVPTLTEVLAMVGAESVRRGRTVGVALELKHAAHHDAVGLPLDVPLLRELARHGLDHPWARVTLMSFEAPVLRRLAERTRLPVVQLLDRGHAADARRAGPHRRVRRRARRAQVARAAPGRATERSARRRPSSATPTGAASPSMPGPSARRTASCPPTCAAGAPPTRSATWRGRCGRCSPPASTG